MRIWLNQSLKAAVACNNSNWIGRQTASVNCDKCTTLVNEAAKTTLVYALIHFSLIYADFTFKTAGACGEKEKVIVVLK